MNYYYPYMGYYPYATIPQRAGLFSSLFRGRGLRSIISGTQKTLDVINQAIPVIKQVKPVVNNAKTMFKVMNEFKKSDTPKKSVKKNNIKVNEKNIEATTYNNVSDAPTFFI